jgi:hypothetical protein
MKNGLGHNGSEQGHWVGDGFAVRSLGSSGDLPRHRVRSLRNRLRGERITATPGLSRTAVELP